MSHTPMPISDAPVLANSHREAAVLRERCRELEHELAEAKRQLLCYKSAKVGRFLDAIFEKDVGTIDEGISAIQCLKFERDQLRAELAGSKSQLEAEKNYVETCHIAAWHKLRESIGIHRRSDVRESLVDSIIGVFNQQQTELTQLRAFKEKAVEALEEALEKVDEDTLTTPHCISKALTLANQTKESAARDAKEQLT